MDYINNCRQGLTLEGVEKLTIPKGIQSQTVLTRKYAGIPNLGRKDVRGNHHLVITVKIPENITEPLKIYEYINQPDEPLKHNRHKVRGIN